MAADAGTVSLTLELLGRNNGEGGEPECRRVTTPGGFKLQVTLPRLVLLSHATKAAELLLNGIDGMANNVTIDRVEISNLRFTADGVGGIMMFMAIKSTKVKHLLIHNVVGTNPTQQDEQALSCLALAFQDSRLETLDLSSNAVGSYIWGTFSCQTQLQSLLLEDVEMDDESLATLDQELEKKMYSGSLSKLCVSNRYPTSEKAIRSVNNILFRCTNLRYLRWANKSDQQKTGLPCRGIFQLAQKMFRLTAHLRQLELEGGEITEEDFGASGLCGALKLLHRLNHLKLRNLSLTPNRAKQVLMAVKTGSLPIQHLDLSKNRLGNEGAEILSQVADIRSLATNLKTLNIEHNGIESKGAVALFSGLGAKSIEDLDIRMKGNPLDMAKVALGISGAKHQVEQERESLRQERDRLRQGETSKRPSLPSGEEDRKSVRNLLSSQASMVSDMQVLQKEVKNLTQERDILIGAFSIMGAEKAVEERNSILGRLSRLESAVQSGRRGGKYPSAKTRHSVPSNTVEMTQKDLRDKAVSEPTEVARGKTRKARPSVVNEKNMASPFPISRDEVLARVLAEVASLQSKKNQVRETILSDVAALQNQRNHPPEVVVSLPATIGLQAKVQEKLATQQNDRVYVLNDIDKLRQDKVVQQRREPTSGAPQQDTSSGSAKRLQSMPSTQRASLSGTRGHDPFPDQPASASSRPRAAPDKASGPEVLLPVASFHSEEHDRSASQGSSSNRFQRLLHRQIQNQLFTLYRNDEGSLKSGSQRSLDLTNSSHHSNASRSRIAKQRLESSGSLSDSNHGEPKSRNPSLGAFVEEDDSKGASWRDSNSGSLPVIEPYRPRTSLESTVEEGGDTQSGNPRLSAFIGNDVDSKRTSRPGRSSQPLPALGLASSTPAGRKPTQETGRSDRRREFQAAGSARSLNGTCSYRSSNLSPKKAKEEKDDSHKRLFETYRNRFSRSLSDAKLGRPTYTKSQSDGTLGGGSSHSYAESRPAMERSPSFSDESECTHDA
jgi:hypothetical protein